MGLLLRTLALKSVLGFGYFDLKNLTVQQLIDSNQRRTLVSSYFGLGMISFNEEVLNILGITDNYRIAKPGKILDYKERVIVINEIMQNYYSSITIEQKAHFIRINKDAIGTRSNAKKIRNAFAFSKTTLKGRNQKS